MDVRPPAPTRRRVPSWLPQVLGYSLSAACLIWVLHHYSIKRLVSDIRSLDWKWVLLAVAADLAVYVVHGWRWNVLLRPIAKLPFWRTVQAIYIGLFANEVLPLRTGELIRCYLLAHWGTLQFSVTLASIALERIIDGFWMLLAFLILAMLVPGIPSQIILLVQIVAGLVVVGGAVLLWIVFHKHHAHSVIRESRWAAGFRHAIEGLHLMGNARTLIRTTGVSFLYLFLQIVTIWGLMKAYGLDLSFWVGAGVLIIIRLGTVVPNAPGNLGVFHAACVAALRLFEVDTDDAVGFSLITFVPLTLPLLIGGAVAVAFTGLNIGEIRSRARQGVEEATTTTPATER